MKKHPKDYALMYGAFLIYSLSPVFAKAASSQTTLIKTLPFMGAEVLVLGIYAIVWQKVLKRFPLVVAMSSKGITVLITLLWSVLLFHESVTLMNIVGAVLILIGIGMVSSDD